MPEIKTQDRREFIRKLFTLALPIGIQNLLGSSLSFVDTLMIGQLGVNQIAGVGLGNQIYFLVSLIFFGTCSGASIFISQFFGARKTRSIQKVMMIAFVIVIFGALVFSVSSIFFPEFLLGLFTPDLAVIETGRQYLVVVGVSYIFSALSFVISTTMRSTGNAKTPLMISFFSLGTDAVLNWILIFGLGPIPRMEVYGAALATVIARLLELILLTISARRKRSPACFHLKTALEDFDRSFLKPYFKVCLPVMFNEFLWALGMTAYKMVYSHMGTDVLASVNVTGSIQDLFMIFSLGIANAAGIMLGNQIGHKDSAGARTTAFRLMWASIISGIFFGGLLALFSAPLPGLFNITPEIFEMTRITLLFMAPVVIIKSLNTTMIVGILRGGGDTRFALFSEIGCIWLLGVPAAIITGLVLKLPIYWVMLLINVEEVGKSILIIPRIISGKWVNDLSSNIKD